MHAHAGVILTDRHALQQLAEQPPRVRQLMHLIYVETVRQRWSGVLLPDVLIAEAVWGDRSRWPQRWKRDLKHLAKALPQEFVEGAEWRPARICPDRCPLHGTDIRHRNLLVFVGAKLLGLLEHYEVQQTSLLNRPTRKYDFAKPKEKELAKEVGLVWQEGRMAYLHAPALVYGSAPWSGLTQDELDVWQAVFAELTTHAQSTSPDHSPRSFSPVGVPTLASNRETSTPSYFAVPPSRSGSSREIRGNLLAA